MSRNQGQTSWVVKGAVHAAAGGTAGAAMGALLGAAGSYVSPGVRAASASVLGVVAVFVGIAELASPRTRGPRGRDHETPQRWMHQGPIAWAVRNGASLGLGFPSRLGFWLWFVVPLTGLLSGSPLVGMLTYGVYGLCRTAAPLAVMLVARRRPRWEYDVWLLGRGLQARAVAGAHLVLTGVAVAFAVGL